MRRPRHLSPDERALWDHVARTVDRSLDRRAPTPAAPAPPPAPVIVAPTTPPLQPFRVGATASHRGTRNLIGGLAQDMGKPPVQMDARAYQRLTRGKLRPEGRIDLHGMTLDQAHPALTNFILNGSLYRKKLKVVMNVFRRKCLTIQRKKRQSEIRCEFDVAKCAACVKLGADIAINYRTTDFVAAMKQQNLQADVILDMVGGDYLARNMAVAAMHGRIVQIAFQQGSKIQADFLPIMLKRLTFTGSTLRPRSVAEKAEIARELEAKVWPLLKAGKCKPQICATFPLSEAAKAHALMESSVHVGKIVLLT